MSGDDRSATARVAPARILVVEDDAKIASLLVDYLRNAGYEAASVGDGLAAVASVRAAPPAAVLLDVMLPGLDGFAIARKLRTAHISTPILILTAKDSIQDMVRGLDMGADDYLTKPFSFELLLARLRALTRRGKDARPPVLEVGSLRLDPAAHDVTRNGRSISLSRTEFVLLELLMRRPGQVMTRELIQDHLWGFDRSVESNTIDAFIRLLRNKINSRDEVQLIHTVRGVGYVMRESEE